uniref:Uncharacterized protein n=1 Tax=Anguilla anguilla TaxID=7936 RepID=A0A0E9W5Y9_ANGAN
MISSFRQMQNQLIKTQPL